MIFSPEDQLIFDRVCRTLSKRIGPELKITIADLATECGFNDKRHCEEYLQLHWPDFPFPLVNLNGIFQPTEAAQINHYLAANRSRIRNVAIRNRSTRRAAIRAGWKFEGKRFLDRPKQAELFEEIETTQGTNT